MEELRVYKSCDLAGLSNKELMRKLDLVKTNPDLTKREIEANVDAIELKLNKGVRPPNARVEKQIQEGAADISDLGQQ